jgi:hypothetical protein
MADRRKKDVDWLVADEGGTVPTWERVNLAVLMDIRDELKRLNAAIYCRDFLAIPSTLRRISANTAKPRKKKATR